MTVWAIILLLLSLAAWLGQVIVVLAPDLAERWSLVEREFDVDPAFHADARGEALWDALILWTMVVAAVLLLMRHPAWPPFALVGGGAMLYFAGRGIAVRRALARRGIRIGAPASVRLAFAALAIWLGAAVVTIALAVRALA